MRFWWKNPWFLDRFDIVDECVVLARASLKCKMYIISELLLDSGFISEGIAGLTVA
jgi:hypothetical protein